MNKQKRILIIRPDRLGDVVLSTPLPREIKQAYPDAFVTVMVRKYTKEVYVNNPYVDEIIIFDENQKGCKSFIASVKEIRKFKFTHSLTLIPNEKINYILFAAGIKTKIGVGHKFYQFITGTKSVSRNKYIPLRHEADYCMDLARKIGVETNNISTEIHLSDEEKKLLPELKKKYLGDKKYLIGIHSTFGNSTPNIKPAEYRKVVDQLLKQGNIQIAITDFEVPEELQKIPGVLYLSRAGRDFFCDIAALDLLVSSSTGPSHVAAALKVKTLTVFCRIPVCSPGLWKPMGNEAIVIQPEEKYCKEKCPGDPKLCWYEGEGGINAVKIVREIQNQFNMN